MSKNCYIQIGDKRIDLTEEQVKQLKLNLNEITVDDIKEPDETEQIKQSFQRLNKHDEYYYINDENEIVLTYNINSYQDNKRFDNANYCLNFDLIKQQNYREILNRRLWRFSYQNGWNDDLWKNVSIPKYYIVYDVDNEKYMVLNIDYSWSRNWLYKITGAVYFVSQEVAQSAIQAIVKPFLKEFPDFNP